ncbi:MAG: molybdopterin-dependent oxidoreductase [Firmicutes bacterium]|nr:molybdopterin-dependent oxidoreductase [Bacillota bacterium]
MSIGKSVPMVDGLEKVIGKALYGADVKIGGRMLVGGLYRSPIPHGEILNVDFSRALAVPGVKKVITGRDTPRIPFGPSHKDQHLLAVDRVRYAGDPVAAVIAADQDALEEALSLIRAEFRELPAVFDPVEAMREGAPLLHESYQNNVAQQWHIVRGDPEAAFREADYVLADRFTTSYAHQGYLEPNACAGSFSAGKLTMWVSTQSPFRVKLLLAESLGLPSDDIRVIQTEVGGGFGGKSNQVIFYICGLLAMHSPLPVRMVHTRHEEFTASVPRVSTIIEVKMGLKKDGALTAKHIRNIGDNGAYTLGAVGVLSVMTTRSDCLYRIRNVRTESFLVYTNKLPTGPYRGFGSPQSTMACESLLDRLAAEAGLDPLEVRLKNAVETGDLTVHGWKIKSCALKECLTVAADRIGWKEIRSRRTPGRGVGLAACIHVSGSSEGFRPFEGSTASVRISPNGRAAVIAGESEVGQGSRTLFAQIAAEELGFPLSRVEVLPVDTEISPFSAGTFADRVTVLGGNSVKRAAADARWQLLNAAADHLGIPAGELVIREGIIGKAGDDGGSGAGSGGATSAETPAGASVDSAVIARQVWERQAGRPILGHGIYIPEDVVIPDGKTKYGNVSATYSFGVHAAEVDVDPDSGAVRLVRVVAAHDLGRAVNPQLATGQVEGAVLQALGYTMSEEISFREGRVENPDFLDYRMPTSCDPPPIETVIVESDDPVGPFGAKGVAEPATVPTPAAIANAFFQATGVPVTELPMTPERIWRRLRKKKG